MSPPTRESPRRPVAYLLKVYPRLSETFILNEILELERQGQPVHIYALRAPEDGPQHADVERVRAPVTIVPRAADVDLARRGRAHRGVARRHPLRYLVGRLRALRRGTDGATERFEQAVAVADSLDRRGIRHVHAHFASLPADVALEVHRLTGIGFSFTAHAKDIFIDEVRPAQLARKLAAARFVVTVSTFNARFLAAAEQSAEIVRVYNGLDLERFAPLPATRRARPALVLAVGRLVEKKGFLDLVDACALLRDRGCEFRCVIVGRGAQQAALRSRVEAHGLGGIVTLVGGQTREAVIDWFAAATVLVAPCVVAADGNRDGLPTVLTEALALGVPVVATHVTGIPELIRHGTTGLLVPPGDPESLAGAIADVLDDPAAAAERAAAGRALVEREFDLRANVAELRRRFEAATR